jgi:hypothetical protein
MAKLIEFEPTNLTLPTNQINTEENNKNPTKSLLDLLDNYRKPVQNDIKSTEGSIVGPENYEKAWDEYLKINPDAVRYKDILTKIAKKESNFRNVQNTAGAPAYGYFQL